MDKQVIYALIGILIFILIAGGIVVAIKSQTKDMTGNVQGIKFWHEDTSTNKSNNSPL